MIEKPRDRRHNRELCETRSSFSFSAWACLDFLPNLLRTFCSTADSKPALTAGDRFGAGRRVLVG